ncbi:hypothetical protein [Pseudomonas sp. Q2-TVG4-2]|uniref:hypothetical protein n=1 Tax=Pseudomonas sp. Q2-TVG4-2 TaxID=1685699 RepID=UPI0015E77773|nr:hypothetical protein [Pseudomonas sp. Q2-TVG4-2]
MTEEAQLSLIIGLTLSLPIGVIAGLYSGLIVTRYSRFSELRNEALRIIRTINYTQEEKKIVVSEKNDLPKLTLISSDLFFLKHRRAADSIVTLSAAVLETNQEAEYGRISIDVYSQRYLHWQNMVRNLQPSKRKIFAITWNL